MNGSCSCGNLRLYWPGASVAELRACQCDYCRARDAAYASDPLHPFTLFVADASRHAVARHGTGTAEFHSCGICGDLLCATWHDEGETYGVVNARCLDSTISLPYPAPISFGAESAEARLARRRQRWCAGVSIQIS